MKRVSAPYDPALRESKQGQSIYNMWRKLRKAPHCEEWENYPTFYYWVIQNGYAPGSWLRRIDNNKPYTPDNCTWYVVGDNERHVQPGWADEWNKTVNRIRKYYGMPPLEGTEYVD